MPKMTTRNSSYLKNSLLGLIVAAILLFAIGCEEDSGKVKHVPSHAALNTTATISWDTPTIKDLVSLLGKSIDSLPKIKKFEKKEKKMELGNDGDEESGVYWFMVEYLYQGKLQMTVESNWVNKDAVHRIILYSNEIIKGMEEADIGQTFKNIRKLKGRTLSTQDGILYVALDKYPEIDVELDISNIPFGEPLSFGVEFPDIPDSLKICSILILGP